ncbi:class I SAM-dependent methyltransferase [Vibrio cholerae]
MISNLEKQRQHFNSIAKQYLKGKSDSRFLKLQSLIWGLVLKSLPKGLYGREISVLEPMCGYTEGLKILSNTNLNIKYSGFDYSEEIVSYLKLTEPSLNVYHGDVTTFSSQEKYDLVILIGGLHHVPNHAGNVVENLASALNPGGIFINFEPTHGNLLNKMIRSKIYKRNKIFDDCTERDFSVSELESFFENAGLDNQMKIYPGLLAYILYYNPYAFPSLNKGSVKFVEFIFNCEKFLYTSAMGRFFSFSTLSVWRKPD